MCLQRTYGSKRKIARGLRVTRAELKQILKDYAVIRDSVEKGNTFVVIKRYRSKLPVQLPPWVSGVRRGISELLKTECDTVREIIKLSYFKGCKDREVIMRLPVSDSGYYRIKRYIEEKIYELCIVYGYVSEQDILRNGI
jgi:hypothetical protein